MQLKKKGSGLCLFGKHNDLYVISWPSILALSIRANSFKIFSDQMTVEAEGLITFYRAEEGRCIVVDAIY